MKCYLQEKSNLIVTQLFRFDILCLCVCLHMFKCQYHFSHHCLIVKRIRFAQGRRDHNEVNSKHSNSNKGTTSKNCIPFKSKNSILPCQLSDELPYIRKLDYHILPYMKIYFANKSQRL